MVELVDTPDLKSGAQMSVRVQVPPVVPIETIGELAIPAGMGGQKQTAASYNSRCKLITLMV